MNLYEISNEYKRLFDELSEMEGITQDIISDTLSPITDEFNNKVIAVTSYFRNLEAEANAIKTAEKSMYERRKAIENKIESIKSYLKSQMISTGINKISCPYFSVTLVKSKNSVNILDSSKIPSEFIREKVIKEPNKELILKTGGCEGAEIIEGYSLRIV